MIRRVLSDALEALGVAVLALVVFGLTGSAWWALVPVGLYLIFVSFMIGGSKR